MLDQRTSVLSRGLTELKEMQHGRKWPNQCAIDALGHEAFEVLRDHWSHGIVQRPLILCHGGGR